MQKRIAASVATIVLLLTIFVGGLTIVLAERQNADALVREQDLARGIIDVRRSTLLQTADDYAHWDEALNNLALHLDPGWADRNFGSGIVERYGIDMVFVIDPDSQTTYAMIDGEKRAVSIDDITAPGFAKLLRSKQTLEPDTPFSAVIIANGHPAVAAIAPLRPFDNPEDSTAGRRHLLVFLDTLDQTRLKRLAQIYQLPNLRITATDLQEDASITLRTFDGRVPIWLAWDTAKPGAAMLRELLPFLILLLLVFASVTVLLLRYAMKTARSLEQSERRAAHDSLTGLLNRAALFWHFDDVNRPRGHISSFALLYCDLDGFKAINDSHGHDIGDEVLKDVAHRIEAAIPSTATVYRLGGDEFAIIVPGEARTAEIRRIAMTVIEAVNDPVRRGDVLAQVGATIGVALAPLDGTSIAELLKVADQALYAGKKAGRGEVNFKVSEISQASA
ncbi:diguanylate cyclase (GGDEF)-like protein [Rhodoligotrophos appendicifer]|uniref:diguanylate cyclase domain-containing protein n=1 Tax=Rhodoligotrophos appendicifer TaxID=987056 RepID=UPI001184A061|nr:diguanylate cyclase [Rhodoligotrophos appendicifer]